MGLPKSGKCCMLIPVILVLGAGLLYTGCAFRIRDSIPATSDVCHSITGRCTSTSDVVSPISSPSSSSWPSVTTPRVKRGFETVSTLGNFAKGKEQPPDESTKEQNYQPLKKSHKTSTQRSWSKLNKIENYNNNEDTSDSNESKNISENDEENQKTIDNDDEIVLIEIDDEEDVITESVEYPKILKENLDYQVIETKKERQEFKLAHTQEIGKTIEKGKESDETKEQTDETKTSEEEINIRKVENMQDEKSLEQEKQRLGKQKEQKLQQNKNEEESQMRESKEQQIHVEEGQKLKEGHSSASLKETREQQEIEIKRKEVEEQRIKDEIEMKLKKEEERRLRQEQVNKRNKEETEQRLKEAAEKKLKKEEEQRLIKEQNDRLREKENQELKIKEQQRIKSELEEKRKLKEEKKPKIQGLSKVKEKDVKKSNSEANTQKILETVRKEAKKKQKEQPKKNEDKKYYEKIDNSKNNEQLTFKLPNKSKKIINNNAKEISSEILSLKQNIASEELISETDKSNTKVIINNNVNIDESNLRVVPLEETINGEPKTTSKKIPEGFSRLNDLNDMLLSVPTFVPNFTAVQNTECQKHGKIFLRQLRGYKLWALQMLDSSAKIPAGLLRGNVNQLGDFDQCLGVLAHVKFHEEIVKVQGKYCLANMDIYATEASTKFPIHLMQGRALIRGNMYDPGYFIPKFTTINWGICLPAACSAEDAKRSIEYALEAYNMTLGIRFMVDINSTMCYVQQKSQVYSKETIGVLYFYAIFICLVTVATARDYFVTTQEKENYSERIIMAFSLKRTINILFKNKDINSSNIDCIHGLRSLSMMSLYILYKMIPMSKIPYANRVTLTEVASNPLSSVLRASLFYSDALLLLNGVVTAHNMTKELTIRDEIRWFCRFIIKYIRLTPSLLAIIFWYAFVMEHTGSGPQWNAIVKSNADICKQNAWINLLYVQNFFPFEEMCATHTYQLALDMQLSLIAPMLVFFLQMKPFIGIIIVFFLLQVSATLRYLATSNNNLSLVIFHGMSVKQMYKTANLTYLLPLHRATPYLFGVTLGVILHYTGKNVRIHKIFVVLGWLIALALGSWSLFSPSHLARRDYVYNIDEAVQYAVLSPISIAIALCWVIFACFTENGGIINKVLSSHWMIVFSRLSYTIYLSQFIIFFYNVGTTRYTSEFHLHKIIDLHEILSVASVSIVLTLLFDIPMQEVKNIIFECTNFISVEVEKSKEFVTYEENRREREKSSDNINDEDEDESSAGGWDWNRGRFTKMAQSEPLDYDENEIDPYNNSRINRQNMRRQKTIRSEPYDEWDRNSMDRRISRSEEHSIDSGRINRMDYKMNNPRHDEDVAPDNYLHPRDRYSNYSSGYTRSPMRDTSPFYRSSSRERSRPKDPEILARDHNNKPIITISKEEDYKNSLNPRGSMSRFFDQQFSVSESEIDVVGGRRNTNNFNRRSSAELRVSDDDDWDNDLRYRRNRYHQERVHSQELERIPPAVVEEDVNDEWNSLKRRSSAEGKMALLKEPLRPGNMELWTVSKMQFGSSQESDDEFEDEMFHHHQRREFREQEPPLPEEIEEEEDINEEEDALNIAAFERRAMSFDEGDDLTNFTLSHNSKRITVQDLSRLSEDDELLKDTSFNTLDVKSNTPGLFKRESIIKSQASEEDPEYLLPERPKLVEQEQEHPFKKAWQEQKSRSEEDGSVTFIIKDFKASGAILENRESGNNEEGNSDNMDQPEEIIETDVTYNVTLNKKTFNKNTDYPKSNTEPEVTIVLPESQESTDEEINNVVNIEKLEESKNTDTDT